MKIPTNRQVLEFVKSYGVITLIALIVLLYLFHFALSAIKLAKQTCVVGQFDTGSSLVIKDKEYVIIGMSLWDSLGEGSLSIKRKQ